MNDINHVYYRQRTEHNATMRFVQMYDAGRVQRFHTTPDYSGTPHQNLAEHSWGVAMMCIELCERIGILPDAELMRAALTHDLSEYWTADLPAHLKWNAPKLSQQMERLQQEVDHKYGFGPQQGLGLSKLQLDILNAADKLELYVYSRQRARAGASAYATVANNIAEHIESLPEDSTIMTHALTMLFELKEVLA